MIDLLGTSCNMQIFRIRSRMNKVTVEEIQDSVENVLIQAGYS